MGNVPNSTLLTSAPDDVKAYRKMAIDVAGRTADSSWARRSCWTRAKPDSRPCSTSAPSTASMLGKAHRRGAEDTEGNHCRPVFAEAPRWADRAGFEAPFDLPILCPLCSPVPLWLT